MSTNCKQSIKGFAIKQANTNKTLVGWVCLEFQVWLVNAQFSTHSLCGEIPDRMIIRSSHTYMYKYGAGGSLLYFQSFRLETPFYGLTGARKNNTDTQAQALSCIWLQFFRRRNINNGNRVENFYCTILNRELIANREWFCNILASHTYSVVTLWESSGRIITHESDHEVCREPHRHSRNLKHSQSILLYLIAASTRVKVDIVDFQWLHAKRALNKLTRNTFIYTQYST